MDSLVSWYLRCAVPGRRNHRSRYANADIMLANEVLPVLVQYWPVVMITSTVAFLLSNKYWKGLNKYPGPQLAAYSNWWRLYDVSKRNHHWTTINLHRKYGDVVRLGPNVLSFSDPRAVKAIYGLNKGMTKVCEMSIPRAMSHS